MEKKKALDIKDFVYLLLATLAQNPGIIDLSDKSKKIITLPIQYKQIIECILCAENGWKERFSILIDTEEYFDDHFMWEQKLGITLKKILADLNKTVEYDFKHDKLLISFTEEEIEMILARYPDEEFEELKYIMAHFALLLVDYIYTRRFQEEYCDYYAMAVKKMHDIKNRPISNENINDEVKEKSKSKVRGLFRRKDNRYYGD